MAVACSDGKKENDVKIGTTNEDFRKNWIETTLKKIPAGFSILDAGAGEKQFRQFCQHLRYFSQDFGKYDGKGDGSALQMGSWDQSDLDYVCDIRSRKKNLASWSRLPAAKWPYLKSMPRKAASGLQSP